ncbi:hypothetical protein D3C76_336720 [compost metagenome]
MTDEVTEYSSKELSAFQLKRIIRAMAQKYPMPITAYLSDVLISSECAAGTVFGQTFQGSSKQHAKGHALLTKPIYEMWRIGRFWVVATKCGNYVLTSFNRAEGRASLRALIAVADKPGVPSD